MSHLLLPVVTGVVSSTSNVTSIVQCGRTVCETDEVCEHILLEPTCRKTIGAVCNKSMFVDIPTTRSTVSPSTAPTVKLGPPTTASPPTATGALPTPWPSQPDTRVPTATPPYVTGAGPTASPVKEGTPPTLTPPIYSAGTPTANPPQPPNTRGPIEPPNYGTYRPTAAPPSRRKKRADKETQCVTNAICIASSDVYRCRCQPGYTAESNQTCHKDLIDSGAVPMTESRLALNILCGYFIMLMYTDTNF